MKTILTILALIIAGGISAASAEEINVPFESQAFDCLYQEDSTSETFTCIFKALKPTGVTVTQENLTEQEKEILEDIAEKRANGSFVEPPRFDHKFGLPTPPDPEFDELIDVQERLCNTNSTKNSDKEYCRMLDLIDICYQGFGKLETIQGVRSFAVTMVTPDIWKSWDYQKNTYLKNAMLKYEECRATQTEHDEVLSAMYADFIVDGLLQQQLYHGDIAENLEIQPTQRLTERSFRHALGDAYEEICYGFYSESFKNQSGCPPKIYSDCRVVGYITEDDYPNNPELLGLPVQDCSDRPLPNEDRNMDDYYNSLSPMQKWKAYQENPNDPTHVVRGEAGDWKVLKGLQR